MKGRRNLFRSTGILGCVLLVGCVAHAKFGTPQDNIMSALQTDLKTDKAMEGKASSTNINQALLNSTAGKIPNAASTPEKRFDVSVKNVPARSFFMGLVSGTPYNMVLSPDISGTITIDLKNVTIQETLDAVRDLYGYDYQETAYGYEVLPPTLQTQVFSVNYLDVARDGTSTTSLTSGEVTSVGTQGGTGGGSASGGGSSPTSSGGASGQQSTPQSSSVVKSTFKSDFWANLQTTLTTMVGTDGGRQVVVNPQAGIVLVRGFPKDLRAVAQYLDTIQNHMNREVVLEAEIMEVTLNDEYKTGINWRALNLTQGNLNHVAKTPNPFNASSTSPPFMVFHSGSDTTSFESLIDLLETQGTVHVLSSPRISTVNNQQAIIKVGSSSFFVTSVTSNQSTASGGANQTSSSVGLTPFFSGITLDVTPQISRSGEIVLHVHPSISKVEDDNKSVNLGGTQGILNLPLAKSTVRESDDIVRAKNGQIIVIGGLMQKATDEELNSVPGASRVPVVGTLFRNTDQQSAKTELVILLRPVVANDKAWSDTIHKNMEEFKQVNRGYHVGSRPEIFGDEGEVND